MIIGAKYKIARRVGAPIFEKTQTQKYAMRQERRGKSRGFTKPKSEYGLQHNEKQKARFTYGITEKQFSNYVKESLSKKSAKPTQLIFERLETRLDNVIYRMGFAPTRFAARQMASHGHMTVNGRRVTIPSLRTSIGDVIGIRPGSVNKGMFATLTDRINAATVPSWITLDASAKTGTIVGAPQLTQTDTMFDLNAVVEFYSR